MSRSKLGAQELQPGDIVLMRGRRALINAARFDRRSGQCEYQVQGRWYQPHALNCFDW